MQLGMIGAGRMGGNMAIRLMKAGHMSVVYARHEQSIKEAVDHGAKGTTDLKEFVGKSGASSF
jgi:6-phosphogluconate dehydrogenase